LVLLSYITAESGGLSPSPESGGPIPLSPPPCSDAYARTSLPFYLLDRNRCGTYQTCWQPLGQLRPVETGVRCERTCRIYVHWRGGITRHFFVIASRRSDVHRSTRRPNQTTRLVAIEWVSAAKWYVSVRPAVAAAAAAAAVELHRLLSPQRSALQQGGGGWCLSALSARIGYIVPHPPRKLILQRTYSR